VLTIQGSYVCLRALLEARLRQVRSHGTRCSMKIAFFDIYNPVPINSGGDWYRFYLLSELGKENDVCEYYAMDVGDKEGHQPQKTNFKVQYLVPRFSFIKHSRLLSIIRPDYLLNQSLDSIQTPDAIFFSVFYYHIAKQIADRNHIPKILIMHNIEWQYLKANDSPLYIPMRLYENHVIRNVDAVVTISLSDYEYVNGMIDEEKVFYIPPKIDTELFNPHGQRQELGNDKFNLVFYGSLDREQNHDALQFIVQELVPAISNENMNSRVRVNIFGSGTPPKHFNLEENSGINFIGQVENPGNYVRAADAVIVPLKNPGGIKIRILEALACGRPVIASTLSIQGLPAALQEYVLTADSVFEYIDAVNMLIEGKTSHVIGANTVLQSLKGESVDDLIEYLKNRALS